MPRWELDSLIRFVRDKSPFYRALYSALPDRVASIESLPILDQGEFWKANGLKGNAVLTGPMRDGIVFKSGGTTGSPKFSVFSREEWAAFNTLFGRGIAAANVKAGDRVANLFYAGELYGSFLFITKSLEESPLGVLQLPIGGGASLEETAAIIADLGANVIAGVPTTILNLAEFVASRGLGQRFGIERVLFGGEAMYPDQRERLSEVFPGVRALSIGYASTDAGPLGYADSSCGPDEHRTFGSDTILEIVDDETRAPISETGREGLLIATDLGRALMPIIRYPVGDRGMWLEPEGARDRKFRLLGRSEEAAKIGLVKLYVEDVRQVLLGFKEELGAANFQMLVVHHDRLDGLVLRIAPAAGAQPDASAAERIVRAIHGVRPLYEQFVRGSQVHAMEIVWVGADGLETNPRTGKMLKVIDRRQTGAGGADVERIRERRRFSGKNIVFRDARQADAPAIRDLFERIYKGRYPLEFGTNVELLRGEIGAPEHYLWLVATDEDERRLAGAMLFICDRRNRMAKAGGGVVLPEYRHYGLGSTMLKMGVRHMTKGKDLVDVIYGTSRTITEGPSKMVAEAGFHKMGFFPNAVQIEELEHLNLDVYLTPKALTSRRRGPYLFTPFYDIYEIARRQLKLERAHLVTERGPLTLSREKLVLKVVKDSRKTVALFHLYAEQKRISNSFFPFHLPNWLLSSQDGGTDVFIWYGGVGKQASILGFRTDRVNIHDLLDSVAGALQRSGASYVELLVDAYDYMGQQEAYTAKYIPSAYFPAMRLAPDGQRDDYFVVSRTFQIIDFTSSYVTQENLPYLKAYMRFYNDLYIEPMKRSDVRRKADE